MQKTWVIRAGRESRFADDFIGEGVVAIGWSELGPIEPGTPKDKILELYRLTIPDASDGNAQNGSSQVKRFLDEVQVGDGVITYDRDRRLYFVGEIMSPPSWSPESFSELPRIRKVNWLHRVSRNSLSTATKNTLGAIQTIFLLKSKTATEIYEKALPIDAPDQKSDVVSVTPPTVLDEEETDVKLQLVEKAEESIEEKITRLNWEQVQDLVAGILRAMGYRTNVSPRGADRGIDIFASPDGLGLEEPRIFVEVKHRPSTSIGSQDIRSFIGGRNVGDKCLYVSTGGFTKEARYEADRANVPLQLLGLVDLRKLYIDYYERLDEETRSLIPLRRVYVPY